MRKLQNLDRSNNQFISFIKVNEFYEDNISKEEYPLNFSKPPKDIN